SARYLLALLAHGVKGSDCPLGGTADLSADIPAPEALVLLPVVFPNLVDHVAVVLDLVAHVSRGPVVPRVVEAEVELHAMLLGQAQEKVEQVNRGHVASLLQEVF